MRLYDRHSPAFARVARSSSSNNNSNSSGSSTWLKSRCAPLVRLSAARWLRRHRRAAWLDAADVEARTLANVSDDNGAIAQVDCQGFQHGG